MRARGNYVLGAIIYRPIDADHVRQIEHVNEMLTSSTLTLSLSQNEAPFMSDTQKIVSTPNSEPQHLSNHMERNFDVMRKELGVEEGLKNILGITTLMLVAFGEHGIKTIGDLADCATDDLDGWSEVRNGVTIRHAGILDHFRVSRQDCEAMIIDARTKAGWFK